jgi:hypothetical protein
VNPDDPPIWNKDDIIEIELETENWYLLDQIGNVVLVGC